jgi:hypothetical protein
LSRCCLVPLSRHMLILSLSSHCTALLFSHCAVWLLRGLTLCHPLVVVVLSLRHPLVVLRRLVVVLPLVAPPSRPLVALPSRPLIVHRLVAA